MSHIYGGDYISIVVGVCVSVCVCKTEEKKNILCLMFGLLEQTAMGVWLSAPISVAVTFTSPIITATVKPPASLHPAHSYPR